MKQLLSPEMRRSIRKFYASKIRAPLKRLLSSAFVQNLNQKIPAKIRKYLIPGFLLLLVLILILSRCSSKQEITYEPVIGSVCIDVLDVHKKASDGSRVLGQLPYELEIEILEEKVGKETTWGRIDRTELPNGKTVKGGWVDLNFVDFTFEDEFIEEVPEDEIEPEEVNSVVVNMGTITADKLNIRKGPDSKQDTNGAYYKGDRVEIVETKIVDDTKWGRTNLGWIGMGYVRMDGTAHPNPEISSDGNTSVLGYGIVTLRELNVRLGPGTQYYKVRTVKSGSRYAYYQLADGWVRLEDGWVSAEYFYLEGTVTDSAFTGYATTNNLNVRTGPSTSFSSSETLAEGETVEILARLDKWGYTSAGWVSMSYIEPVKPTYSTGSGTITNGLNIRQEASADSEKVGTYTTGDRVTILEVNENWGRTDKGWINLKYVNFDTVEAIATTPETVPETT